MYDAIATSPQTQQPDTPAPHFRAVIDYEQLVEQYERDLVSLLRGHRSLDYLEMWVPDEDPLKSLLNMVEAAQSSGCDRIDVYIAPRTVRALDADRLLATLAAFGAVSWEPAAPGIHLSVRDLDVPLTGNSECR